MSETDGRVLGHPEPTGEGPGGTCQPTSSQGLGVRILPRMDVQMARGDVRVSRGVRFSLQTQAMDLCPRRPTARRYLPLTDSPDPRRGGSGNELLFCGPRRFFPMRPQPPRREAPLGGEGSGTSSSVPKSVTAGASGTWGRRGAGAAALVGDGHAAGLAGSPRGWRLLCCPPRSGVWLLGQTAAPAESPALGSRCLYSPWRVISLPLSSPWYQPCPIPSALNPLEGESCASSDRRALRDVPGAAACIPPAG